VYTFCKLQIKTKIVSFLKPKSLAPGYMLSLFMLINVISFGYSLVSAFGKINNTAIASQSKIDQNQSNLLEKNQQLERENQMLQDSLAKYEKQFQEMDQAIGDLLDNN
jgi:uncharacterized protein HemX